MKRLLYSTFAILLTGCTITQLVASNPRIVSIRSSRAPSALEQSQSMADAECGKYKRFAQLQAASLTTGTLVFNCVD